MGLIKSAVGDAVLTSLWEPLTLVISTAIGFAQSSAAGLLLTTFLVATLVLVFSILGDVSFNYRHPLSSGDEAGLHAHVNGRSHRSASNTAADAGVVQAHA